jgi:hypothetical protein
MNTSVRTRAAFHAQAGPFTLQQFHHLPARLVVVQDPAQNRRHRPRGLGAGVGKDVDQLAGDQQLVAPEDGAHKLHGRGADARAAHRHVDLVVGPGRGMELDDGLFHVQIAFEVLHRRLIGQPDRAPVVGDGRVEVHQVMGVEDDLLHVHLGPAHPQAVKKAEILAFHGEISQKEKRGISRSGRRAAALAPRQHWPSRPRGWPGPG